ncbi:MAG: hypothetical protein M0042_01815 [Nitrospiraceae bacterium]|nr:hypothetical protein [Nitrospiraceae bacterium]
MLTTGGQRAGKGTYWDMMTGTRVVLAAESTLPGGPKTMYVKAPAAVMLAAGPILGLVFAIFLPMMAIVMAVSMAAGRIAASLADAAAATTSFAWRPIESYLAGRRKQKESRERKEDKKS